MGRRPGEREAVREGMKVEAQYKGRGKWYQGVAKFIHPDGFIDVEYDDGERDLELPPECVQAMRLPRREERKRALFVSGEVVETNCQGREDEWLLCKIFRDRDDGTYDVLYKNGDSDLRVHEGSIRRVEDSDIPSKISLRIEEGSKVEGNYRGKGKWYTGKVIRDRRDGTFDIAYDDGESEIRVDEALIRSSNPSKRRFDDYDEDSSQKTSSRHMKGDTILVKPQVSRSAL